MNIISWLQTTIIVIGLISLPYWVPYLIKKGWDDGKNASINKRVKQIKVSSESNDKGNLEQVPY